MSNPQQKSQSAKAKKAQQVRRYLRHALSKNPLWESEEILQVRRKTFRIEKAVAESPVAFNPQSGKRRDAMRRAVSTIQQEFWSLPLDNLQRRLAAINVKEAPDVAGVVKRLRTAAACRSEFPRLASAKDIHLPLVHAFKTAIVLPPSQAGYVREQFLRSINNRKQLKKIKKSVGIIRKEYGVLFALEKDWFKLIMDTKAPREIAATTEGSGEWGISLSWPVVFVVFFIIRILIRLAG